MDEERGAPTVWMRSIRFHTYHGRPKAEGVLYLCHEEEVENIVNLRFARREPPPERAQRKPR
jgi:hypothetical protein